MEYYVKIVTMVELLIKRENGIIRTKYLNGVHIDKYDSEIQWIDNMIQKIQSRTDYDTNLFLFYDEVMNFLDLFGYDKVFLMRLTECLNVYVTDDKTAFRKMLSSIQTRLLNQLKVVY